MPGRTRSLHLTHARVVIAGLLTLSGADANAAFLRVPEDQTTIQAGIDAVASGDTVLVSPGTYAENLTISGKGITLRSEAGPSTTIVDGGAAGPVLTITTGDGNESLVEGFTLQNGHSSDGAGIVIREASPHIRSNVIRDNHAGYWGGGIYVYFASPTIEGNTIEQNTATSGGGIQLGGAATPIVRDNLIRENQATAEGGAMQLFAAGYPTITRNTIVGNTAGRGGAIVMYNLADALIAGNVIVSNTAGEGGGLYWLTPSGTRGPYVIQNTIAWNEADLGSQLYADGYDGASLVQNNIVVSRTASEAIYCGNFNDQNPPQFRSNNIYVPGIPGYGGLCGDQTGFQGNIAQDPYFRNPMARDFRLRSGSPCIDAGDNAAPGIPDPAIDGAPRFFDGNDDNLPIVDMGALEWGGEEDPVFPSRAFLPGGNRLVPTEEGASPVCAHVELTDGLPRDLVPATMRMVSEGTGSVSEIPVTGSTGVPGEDTDGNGTAEVPMCFARADLARLFDGVQSTRTIRTSVSGTVSGGGTFEADLDLYVIGVGSPIRASVSPNPVRGAGAIRFRTTGSGFVRLRLYEVSGRLVHTLEDRPSAPPGMYEVPFDTSIIKGGLAPGIYFLKLETSEGIASSRLIVIR